jgi:hypothetical protein
MARLSKAEYPRILQMVDGENRKVAEVAAEYGCTPANIYALLSRLRRDRRVSADIPPPDASLQTMPGSPSVPVERSPQAATIAPMGADLFGIDLPVHAPVAPMAISSWRREAAAVEIDHVDGGMAASDGLTAAPVELKKPEPPAPMAEAIVTTLPRSGDSKKARGMGASLAKPGMALIMRTAEGEENLTPFRSLDDLLSAVKPILRAAARSPDAVWFSVQPVDLSSLESDAA